MKNGVEVIRSPGALDEAELIHTPQGVDCLSLRSKASVTREVPEANPQPKAAGAFCVGTNQIDLEAATELSICAFNVSYSNTCSAVEPVIGEIIGLCRRVTVKNSRPHYGIWDKFADDVREVRDRIFDIIGYNNIGTQLPVFAEAMGLNVIFYDIAERLALGNATQMPTMESVLHKADVVSVYVDGQLINTNLFGVRGFAMMKSGTLLINPSCGSIVNIDASHDALVLGHLAGAVVDIFLEKPSKGGDPFTSLLVKLDNMILIPHIGGSTEKVQCDIGRFVANKIANCENTGSTDIFVSLPNLQFGTPEESCYRAAFVRHNTLGASATVSSAFARTGANIGAQILGTAGQTGYVLTDINSGLPAGVTEGIRSMRDMIRLITTHL